VKETLKEAVEDGKNFCFYNERSDGIPLNESGNIIEKNIKQLRG